MKKRIRKTGEIIDVIAYTSGTVKSKLDTVSYIDSKGNEVVESINYYWDLDDVDTENPDYWEKLRHQAALAALSGISSRPTNIGWKEYVNECINISDYFIEKLKGKT